MRTFWIIIFIISVELVLISVNPAFRISDEWFVLQCTTHQSGWPGGRPLTFLLRQQQQQQQATDDDDDDDDPSIAKSVPGAAAAVVIKVVSSIWKVSKSGVVSSIKR